LAFLKTLYDPTILLRLPCASGTIIVRCFMIFFIQTKVKFTVYINPTNSQFSLSLNAKEWLILNHAL
jgi:hypothetical protein